MHFGEDIRILTKLLESANIKAAYRVKNTTEDYSINRQKYKYNYSGNFKLECHNCEQVYAGQTGRDFRFRFKEQIYGTLDTIMKSHSMPNIFLNVNIGSVQKWWYGFFGISHERINMDIWESFNIYKATEFKPILNDQHDTDFNTLFYLTVEKEKEMQSNRNVGNPESQLHYVNESHLS